jgi:N-methylhydantoinase A
MLAARPGRQLSLSRPGLLAEADEPLLGETFAELASQGIEALAGEGIPEAACEVRPSVDLRYAGQSYTLNLPWRGTVATTEDFHLRHLARYGHRLSVAVELVNLRVQVRGPETGLRLPPLPLRPPARPFAACAADGVADPVPHYRREELAPGQRLEGPALIVENVATSWLPAQWLLEVDPVGHLRLSRRIT